eukprot:4763958-Pleurochrysis_carterae.AAC.1
MAPPRLSFPPVWIRTQYPMTLYPSTSSSGSWSLLCLDSAAPSSAEAASAAPSAVVSRLRRKRVRTLGLGLLVDCALYARSKEICLRTDRGLSFVTRPCENIRKSKRGT